MIPIQPLVDALSDAITAARHGAKEKGVHRLRVTTRRLDTWLRLAEMRVLRDDLRWLRSLAGPVRDLDILLSDPLYAPLRQAPIDGGTDRLAQLRGLRAESLAQLHAALQDSRVAGLCTALALLPPVPVRRAVRSTRRLLRRVRRLEMDASRPNEIHDGRRAVRRLRFALELLGNPVPGLVELQDVLGRVSDLTLPTRLDLSLALGPTAGPDLEVALNQAVATWTSHQPTLEAIERWISSCSDTQPPSA